MFVEVDAEMLSYPDDDGACLNDGLEVSPADSTGEGYGSGIVYAGRGET